MSVAAHTPGGALSPKCPGKPLQPPQSPGGSRDPAGAGTSPRGSLLPRSAHVHVESHSKNCLCGLFPSSQRSNPCIVQHCISGGKWSCVHSPAKKGQQVRTAKNSSLKKLPSSPRCPPPREGSSKGGPGVSRGDWGVSQVAVACHNTWHQRAFHPGSWQSRAGHLTPPER